MIPIQMLNGWLELQQKIWWSTTLATSLSKQSTSNLHVKEPKRSQPKLHKFYITNYKLIRICMSKNHFHINWKRTHAIEIYSRMARVWSNTPAYAIGKDAWFSSIPTYVLGCQIIV